jgi:hypothetical protein
VANKYRNAETKAARRYGLNPRIFRAMIGQESGHREGLTSSAGARDIAQFEPATAREYGVTLGDNRVADDLDGAARYLAANLRKYGSYHAALSVYNSGRPDAYKDPQFAGGQTYNYVRSILSSAGSGGGGGGRTGGATPAQPAAYRTVPGVDNSAQRDRLKLAYFENSHDPNALLELQAGLDQARDTPSRRVRVRGAQPQPSGGGKQRSFGVGGELHELFWNGPGAVTVQNGQRVPKGFVEGHTDHVHVAGGPKSVIALGLLAQRMGLKVGENPRFGGVHPVHVADSYHYRREAIDVSGDPKKMAAFARRVARAYGL